MAEILSTKAFRDAKVFGCGMTIVIQPDVVVESGGLDDERVVLLPPDRVTKPMGIWILRKLASIRENLAIRMNGLVKNHNHAGGVQDFERIWDRGRAGNAAHHASTGRVFFAQCFSPVRI